MAEIRKGLIPIDETNDMWSVLTREERTYLRENTKVHEFKKSEYIYKEGDVPTHLFCLISGKVKVVKNSSSQRDLIIRMIGQNENFSYREYFIGENYSTNAIAMESVMAYSVSLNVVNHILMSNASLAMSFIKVLSRDFIKMDERIVSFTQKHIRGRLADALVSLLDTYGYEEDNETLYGYTMRHDIAAFANMTTSNAIRTLANFESEGIIELDARRIKVLDERHLRRVSEEG